MALLKTLGKRALNCYKISSSLLTVESSRISLHIVPQREYVALPDPPERGFFWRLFHQRASEQFSPGFPKIFSVPVEEKLREKLLGINISGDRLQFQKITQPQPQPLPTDATVSETLAKVSIEDARKLSRVSQIEKLKAKLREIPKNSISYHESVQICLEGCGDESQGLELTKVMDQSGNVVILGNVVFLHPEYLTKSLETIISESMAIPNDPRRKELEEMEKQKDEIDKKARVHVRGELYCGLGFLMVQSQTLGCMRLTFWELSWDVMEPICFFGTSLHFASAYCFFLSTSTEPSFESYFQRRFKTKQKKLMKAQNFDIEKYTELRRVGL